jgi:DNA-binding Lrp family transcriptional regulator
MESMRNIRSNGEEDKRVLLDLSDKKIILQLIENSREHVSVISKKTRLTREIINYRISKLESEEIITGFVARINQPLFCSGVALMLCKLVRTSKERHNEIISFIKKSEAVNWCIETCGTFDIAMTILYDAPMDLARTTTEIQNFIGANLKAHEISFYIDEYKFDRTGLISNNSNLSKPSKKRISNTSFSKKNVYLDIHLDEIDKRILVLLAENCRMKNVDIAKKIKIAEDVVRLRIKNLEKRNVITGYTISVSPEKLGYEAYQMLMTIENMTDAVIGKIKYYVQENPYVVFCTRMSGKHNMVMNIYARDRGHFNDILQDIRNTLPEISDYEFQFEMKTHKEVFVPEKKIKSG